MIDKLTPEITASRAKMIAARRLTDRETWDKMIAAAVQDPTITSTEIFVDYDKFATSTQDQWFPEDNADRAPLEHCLCRIVTQSSANCKFNASQRDMVHHTWAVVHTSRHRDGIMRSCPYVALRLAHNHMAAEPEVCDIVRAAPPVDWVRQGLRFTKDKIIWDQENCKRVERWEPPGIRYYDCVVCQQSNYKEDNVTTWPGFMGRRAWGLCKPWYILRSSNYLVLPQDQCQWQLLSDRGITRPRIHKCGPQRGLLEESLCANPDGKGKSEFPIDLISQGKTPPFDVAKAICDRQHLIADTKEVYRELWKHIQCELRDSSKMQVMYSKADRHDDEGIVEIKVHYGGDKVEDEADQYDSDDSSAMYEN